MITVGIARHAVCGLAVVQSCSLAVPESLRSRDLAFAELAFGSIFGISSIDPRYLIFLPYVSNYVAIYFVANIYAPYFIANI